MSRFDEIVAEESSLLCKTYARYPLAIAKAKGSLLWDFEGKEYIDLLAGIAVTTLGHCNSEITEIICQQAEKLIHVSNLFYQEEQIDLANKLLNTCDLSKVFFCNSGAEANEAAIKIARRYKQRVEESEAFEVITLTKAFHGRTLATIAATGQAKFQDGFAPIPTGFLQAKWGDIQDLQSKISNKTAAIMIEAIQGEGGVRPLIDDYASSINELCSKNNILLICDEVQAGLSRSGSNWAFQNFSLSPDIITTSKALANGLPLGAMLCTDKVSEGFSYGSHATTFGGGALVTAVGAKVIEILQRDNLADRAKNLGEELRQQINNLQSPKIREVRGLGLMIGIELNLNEEKSKALWLDLIDSGIVVNLTQGNTLRLLPALNVPEEYLTKFVEILDSKLKNI